jgi:parvulin-like peptidyl-prolyl isomerase
LIRRFWLVCAALVLLSGCGSAEAGIYALQPTPEAEEVVARITYRNGTVDQISQTDLEQYQGQISQLSGFPVDPELALNQLLVRRLLLHQARVTDVMADPEGVQRVVNNVLQAPDFCANRVAQPTSDRRALLDECARLFGFAGAVDFRSFIAEELTIDQVTQQEAPQDLVRAAHIVVESYEQAVEVYNRVRPGGANFAELAREYSIEQAAQQTGGELPPFNQQGVTMEGQQLDPTFAERTWALQPEFEQTGNALSEPFQTESGWHIVRILGFEASRGRGGAIEQFRQAVLERALQAELADLQQPDDGEAPLIGVVEILQPQVAPEPEPVPTSPIEPALPEASPEASPEATDEAPVEASPEAIPADPAEASPEATPTQ